MKFDSKGRVDPLSSGLEAMQTITGGTEGATLKASDTFGMTREVDPKNSLAINHGLGDHDRVKMLVQTYHQDDDFMQVAVALLGQEQVAEHLSRTELQSFGFSPEASKLLPTARKLLEIDVKI